jgi:hypothetical protein
MTLNSVNSDEVHLKWRNMLASVAEFRAKHFEVGIEVCPTPAVPHAYIDSSAFCTHLLTMKSSIIKL